jgi:hypothetical protein
VVENVGDGKIVLKGCDHQHHRRQKNYSEAGNAGATCGFAQPS